jgi:hypothetical protein
VVLTAEAWRHGRVGAVQFTTMEDRPLTRTRSWISAAVLPLVGALALVAPGAANAAGGVWVSASTPIGTDSGCSNPGFNTVQSALSAAAAGTQINVCAGTYTEQIEITKAAKLVNAQGGEAILQMPSKPTPSQTTCDKEPGLEAGQIDEVSICTTGKVTLDGFRIVALAPIETCGGGLNAVFVAGNGELIAGDDVIEGASTTLNNYKGCQHGIAVEVGAHKANEIGHAKLEHVTVDGYEKNGPTVSNPGSTLQIKKSVITGEGASPYIAQNGIEVAYGGKGTIAETTVTGNECEVANVCDKFELGEQATGILFYGAETGSKVTKSTFSNNDIGAYYASTSPTQPTKPEVKITSSKLTSDRYEGAVLEEGDAELVHDTINGTGEVGIDVTQFASQPYADDSSASGCTIEGMSVAAVAISTDKSPSDPSGVFTIKGSSISKNAAEVLDPSTNFTVTRKGDS